MSKKYPLDRVASVTHDSIDNEAIFDKKVEEVIEDLGTLTPSTQTIKFNTPLASDMTEDKLFDLYRQMDNDSIISAALDLFADNVAQENPRTGHVVSVQSQDKTFQEEINGFLHDVVKMDTESWNIVRSLALYGKVVLDTKASNGGRDWAFVEVEKPEHVIPLTYGQDLIKYFAKRQTEEDLDNKTVQFYGKTSRNNESLEYHIEPRDRYIVGFNARKHLGKMKVETESAVIKDKQSATSVEELFMRGGKSLLEGVVETWQTLSSLEDTLFINRMLKSTAFNVVTIDVSETNNKQAQKMIDDVKASFKSSETLDARANRYSNRQNPIPVNDYIYVPVRGEKGTVTIEQVGGEVGDIDLTDIEYYRNKLFAGLGVLKAYLGFEETTPGGLGDTTLTMLDERFSRKVKRLRQQLGYINKQIIEYYWVHSSTQRTIDNIPEYDIVLGKISTREEQADRQQLLDDIAAAEAFLSLTSAFPDHVSHDKLFDYVFNTMLGIDLALIDTSIEEKEMKVTLKQIHETTDTHLFQRRNKIGDTIIERRRPKYSKKKQTKVNFIESTRKTLLHENKELFQEIYHEYDIFIELQDGKTVRMETLIDKPLVRKMLGEHTYKDLKNRTQQTDPERIKKSKKITGKYIGYDPDEDVIIFEMAAEDPSKNKREGKPTSYESQVRLKDLINIIKQRQTGNTDLSLVQLAMQGDIAVGCTCPASKYWGQQYNGTKQDYSVDINTVEPTRNKQYQVLCKHVVTLLTILPFHTNTIVRDLRQAKTFETFNPKEMTQDEELETLDKIVELETGKPVEQEDTITDTSKDPTHKTKKKLREEEPKEDTVDDKDKGLKDKLNEEAPETKKKPKGGR